MVVPPLDHNATHAESVLGALGLTATRPMCNLDDDAMGWSTLSSVGAAKTCLDALPCNPPSNGARAPLSRLTRVAVGVRRRGGGGGHGGGSGGT
jgi:hypothetical protein